jgi:hypothetical protein
MRYPDARPKLIRRTPLKHAKPLCRSVSIGAGRRVIRFMRVCVSAIASDGDCIICITDKAVSYGDYIQWDSDTTKIIPMSSSNAVLMVSGGENCARVVSAITELKFIENVRVVTSLIESSYQRCYDDVVQIKYLRQNGITRDEYIAAVSGSSINRHFEHIADEIEHFNLDVDIIICGYIERKPFILAVTSPGKVIDASREGFHAVGSGFDHAIARLLFQEHKRTNSIPETLYDCFDAKAHAELASGVGYEWDAYLVLPAKSVLLDEKIKPLLDAIWVRATRSPFYKRKIGDKSGPPREWRKTLDEIINTSLSGADVIYLKGAGTLVVSASVIPISFN